MVSPPTEEPEFVISVDDYGVSGEHHLSAVVSIILNGECPRANGERIIIKLPVSAECSVEYRGGVGLPGEQMGAERAGGRLIERDEEQGALPGGTPPVPVARIEHCVLQSIA